MIALGLAFAVVATVTTPSCVPLEGGQILARHVAAVVSEFAALAPDLVLGIAPQPGVRRIFAARELQRLASLHNVRLERDREVCLEWKVEPVARARMLAAMRETLSDPSVHIEIVDLSRHPAPRGELAFPREGLVEPPPSQPKAAVYWKGYVRYAGQKRFEVWARVRVWLPSTRLVAAAALPAGSPVRAEQVRSEPWEDFPYGSWLLRHAAQAVGRVPKRQIRAGAYLDSSLLGKPKEILKGDLIRVEVRAGAARIATEAVAESDAGTGDVVLVRNRATGKKFPAKAAGHGLATLELRGAFTN
jgi:flagella basal body P-ring formation protein FlgA